MFHFSDELKSELSASKSKSEFTDAFKRAWEKGEATIYCPVSFPPPTVKFRSPQKHHLKKN